MKLSLYTDYSLRVLLYLGTNGGRRVTLGEIADGYGISKEHLRKVVHMLGKLGYVETHRGKGGGFTLGADPGDINIGEVVEATEPRHPVIDCTPCIIAYACTLQSVLKQAENAFYEVLKGYQLKDLLNNVAMQQILFRTTDT